MLSLARRRLTLVPVSLGHSAAQGGVGEVAAAEQQDEGSDDVRGVRVEGKLPHVAVSHVEKLTDEGRSRFGRRIDVVRGSRCGRKWERNVN